MPGQYADWEHSKTLVLWPYLLCIYLHQRLILSMQSQLLNFYCLVGFLVNRFIVQNSLVNPNRPVSL